MQSRGREEQNLSGSICPFKLIAAPEAPVPSQVAAMSIFPSIQKDCIIARLPQCFRREATLHGREDINEKVNTACPERHSGSVAWKASKVITAGKTCLINTFVKTFLTDTISQPWWWALRWRISKCWVSPARSSCGTGGQVRDKCVACMY